MALSVYEGASGGWRMYLYECVRVDPTTQCPGPPVTWQRERTRRPLREPHKTTDDGSWMSAVNANEVPTHCKIDSQVSLETNSVAVSSAIERI